MVQPDSRRLVTHEALTTRLASDIPATVGRWKGRRLGDQCQGSRKSKVPTSKCAVSLNMGVDGYVADNNPQYIASQMYDVAEVNWSEQTLGAYGSTLMNYSKPNAVATTQGFTTILEGTHATVTLYKLDGIAQDVRVWIDDEEVTDWYLGSRAAGVLQTNTPIMKTNTAGFYFISLNFAKRGFYKIRVDGVVLSGGTTTHFLTTNKDGKFHKPAKQRTFGVISDSWYDTVSQNTSLNAGVELAALMGWKQWNLSVGGSGFINPGPSGAGDPQHYASDKVFASLAKAPDLDFLLLNGSVNDMGYPVADVLTAMQAFFTKWRTVRPDTPIVWQGLEPQSYFENIYGAPAIVAREEAQREVAAADPSVIGVVLPAKENWLTGTGNTGAANGTGNQDFVIGPDSVHLSAFGTIFNGGLMFERIQDMKTWKV